MATITRSTVEEKIQNGYDLKLGESISKGFEIYMKEWLLFSLYALTAFFILVVSSITIIGLIFTAYPTMLGFAIAGEKVENGQTLQFSDFFDGYKKTSQLAVLGLIYMGLVLLIIIPYFGVFFSVFFWENNFDGDFYPGTMFFGFFFVYIFFMMIASYLIQVLLFFAPYLIYFGDYSPVEALKNSFRLGKRNFWWLLLFVFIVGVISQMGAIAIYIGLLATIPAGALISYSMVKNVLMSDEFSEIENIGEKNI
ncbi:MAG: hypothetical protein WDA08_11410 [Weeksellaceae bacterium]